MKSDAKVRSEAAMRQIHLGDRRRAQGFKRIGLWIPGKTHAKVMREAKARGITFHERIIEKLDA